MTLLAYLERGWRVRFSSQGWCKRVGQRMGKSRLDVCLQMRLASAAGATVMLGSQVLDILRG